MSVTNGEIDCCGYSYCSARETVGYLNWRREKVRLCAEHMKPEMHPKDLRKGLVLDPDLRADDSTRNASTDGEG